MWLWVTSLLAAILGAIATTTRTCQQLTTAVAKDQVEDSSQCGTAASNVDSLRRQQKLALLSIVQHIADLILAVHWIPGKRLWSGRLTPTGVGVLGTTSSLVGLYSMATLSN